MLPLLPLRRPLRAAVPVVADAEVAHLVPVLLAAAAVVRVVELPAVVLPRVAAVAAVLRAPVLLLLAAVAGAVQVVELAVALRQQRPVPASLPTEFSFSFREVLAPWRWK